MQCQRLEERKLFAADVGFESPVMGPAQLESPAAEVSMAVAAMQDASPISASLLDDVPHAELTDSGTLLVRGTDLDDQQDVIVVIDEGTNLRVWMRTLEGADQVHESNMYFRKSDVDRISFLGRKGDDTFINQTSILSIQSGGEGNDHLFGGSNTDILHGENGNDRLYGNGGNDTLNGGANDDHLQGDNGRDHMYGGDGRDTMYGGNGNDTVDGGGHNDTIFGGWGNDTLRGGIGHDVIYGDNLYASIWDGHDIINGQSGSDVLIGHGGNDTIRGEDGWDLIDGGAGNDNLMGGANRDRIFGGSGNDRLDGGHDGIYDYLTGGSGRDTFVRHRRVFSQFKERESIFDYNRDEGDQIITDWHW